MKLGVSYDIAVLRAYVSSGAKVSLLVYLCVIIRVIALERARVVLGFIGARDRIPDAGRTPSYWCWLGEL